MGLVYKHAVTGRTMRVRPGTRAHRLVEQDNNWQAPEAPKPRGRRAKKSAEPEQSNDEE